MHNTLLNRLIKIENNMPDNEIKGALYSAIRAAQSLEKIKQLMGHIEENDRGSVADIALVYAAATGSADIMSYLCTCFEYAHLPLHFSQALREASLRGHSEAVEFLFALYDERERESMTWSEDTIWREGFDEALEANQGKVVSIYVNKFNHLTEIALLDAAVLGKFEVLKNVLHPQKTDINIIKETFDIALINENWEIVKYLLYLIEEEKLPSDIFNELINNRVETFAGMFYPKLKQIRISLYSLKEILKKMDADSTIAITGWALVDSITDCRNDFYISLIENRKEVDKNYLLFKKSCESIIKDSKSVLACDPDLNNILKEILVALTNCVHEILLPIKEKLAKETNLK